MTQSNPNVAIALEAITEGLNILQLLACVTNNTQWINDSLPLGKLNELARSLNYDDAQSVHSQVENDRDIDECYAKIRQLRADLKEQSDTILAQTQDEISRMLHEGLKTEAGRDYWLGKHTEAEVKINDVHLALDECEVERNYPDGEAMGMRTRVFFLLQRAERAEAGHKELYDELAQAKLAVHVHDKSLDELAQTVRTEQELRRTEHSRRREVETGYTNGHKALTAAGVAQTYASGRPITLASRVVRLKQRAETAEALAQLVTKKAADLLERLANHTASYADSFADPNSSWPLLRRAEIRAARNLAAQIRETLDDSQA